MNSEPTRTRFLVEIAFFAAVVLLVGAAFVALRFTREGPRVLNYDPRLPR